MSTITRRIATVVAALTVSLGVVAVSSPAHSLDTSWGRNVSAPSQTR
jgi:hypothetical protein